MDPREGCAEANHVVREYMMPRGQYKMIRGRVQTWWWFLKINKQSLLTLSVFVDVFVRLVLCGGETRFHWIGSVSDR